MQQSCSWWLGLVVCEFCDSEPLVYILFLALEQQCAAHHFIAVLSYGIPHLAAVWIWLRKSSLFHFGHISSDILNQGYHHKMAELIGQAWLSWRCKQFDYGLPGLVEETTNIMLINLDVHNLLLSGQKQAKTDMGKCINKASTALTSSNFKQTFLHVVSSTTLASYILLVTLLHWEVWLTIHISKIILWSSQENWSEIIQEKSTYPIFLTKPLALRKKESNTRRVSMRERKTLAWNV